ncbi:MAG: AAA family ATPase [Clostridia bacterium]|nr:AAA family ATPase [Clostridia bacterium]
MKVIIINGPMGVGKTTVGKYIADTYAGTAFIDGDWCMDIHPFVGNRETKTMAVDNILHLIRNYQKCSVCKMVVLAWLMDDDWVYKAITDGIADMGLTANSVTLICRKDELISRWKNDTKCEWRTDDWLDMSIRSLTYFSSRDNCIDTTDLSVSQVAQAIMK